MWKRYNPNPQGLQTIDCVVRAISAVTGWPWDKTHKVLSDKSRNMGDMPSSDRVWHDLLRELGFRKRVLPDRCPDCYTVGDFANDHPRGVYVLGPHQHAVAVIDGTVYDSWDSSNTVPLYDFEVMNDGI